MSAWLLLDVDGPLVADGSDTVDPAAAAALSCLPAQTPVAWYSGRERQAAEVIGPQVGLPGLDWVPIPDGWPDTPAYAKLAGLRRWMQSRPRARAVVIDDDPPERRHWPERVHFVTCPSLLDPRMLDQALSLTR